MRIRITNLPRQIADDPTTHIFIRNLIRNALRDEYEKTVGVDVVLQGADVEGSRVIQIHMVASDTDIPDGMVVQLVVMAIRLLYNEKNLSDEYTCKSICH